MKKIFLIFMIICSIFFNSCYNYKDINRLLFVTSVLIDVDEEGHLILYSEVFASTRVSGEKMGKEDRMVFKNKGTSLLDAARNINLSSNCRLNYTQNKAIIFTEKAAKYGLDNFVDTLDRDQELLLRQYVFILSGDPEEFMKTQLTEEKYTGIFLYELIQNSSTSSKGSLIRLDEFLNNRLMGSSVNVVNIIGIDNDQIEKKISIQGLAVIKDDKMAEKLSPEEGKVYNFMVNNFKYGTLDVPNPEHAGKSITLEVLNSNTKTKLSYEENKINIEKQINTKTTFAGSEGSFKVTDYQNREALSEEGEKNIEESCMKLFNKFKEKDIDIFNIKRELVMRYPKKEIKDVMGIADLKVNSRVTIEGSQDKNDNK